MRVGVIVINFGTSRLAVTAVESVLREPDTARVLVIDNASPGGDGTALRARLPADRRIEYLGFDRNVGFAGASETGIARLLEDETIEAVLSLNSDAVLQPGALARLAGALDPARRIASAGGRVLAAGGEDRVDSLGIAIYRPLLASNRMDTSEAYFGPTGGCALYHRSLLDALRRAHGHVFDRDFFCYAEDTDVAARALLLGFEPAYVDEVVARHVGQASSGGGFNDFVLYHGIRNSIWMAVHAVPAPLLWRNAFWIALLHAGIVVRHAARGRARVVWRLYRDAWRGLGAARAKRRIVQRSAVIGARAFARRVTPRFYERGYLRRALRELFLGPR